MQLFILDRECAASAMFLADVHIIKMCLETAQILSGVIYRQCEVSLPSEFPRPYAINHPVLKAIQTPAQVNWIVKYNMELQKEFIFRFSKNHAYAPLAPRYTELLYVPEIHESCENLARTFRNFQSNHLDIVEAHREYYRYKLDLFKRAVRWTKRPIPVWLATII